MVVCGTFSFLVESSSIYAYVYGYMHIVFKFIWLTSSLWYYFIQLKPKLKSYFNVSICFTKKWWSLFTQQSNHTNNVMLIHNNQFHTLKPSDVTCNSSFSFHSKQNAKYFLLIFFERHYYTFHSLILVLF